MGRKGLSLDEKRAKICELFFEARDVFTLKDVEKLATAKGVTRQSVKEVLDGLVADGMVIQDKVGSSNYFWMFPSETARVRHDRIVTLAAEITSENEKLQNLKENIANGKKERSGGATRKHKLEELQSLEAQLEEIDTELKTFADNDPREFKRLKSRVSTVKESANMWTDNVYTLRSFCVKKFGMDKKVFNKNFELGEEFDYVE